MKTLIGISISILILSGIALSNPAFSLATSGNTNHNNSYSDDKKEKDNKKDKDEKKDKKEKEDKKDKDPYECYKDNRCEHEVPEFGMIPAAFALVASSGSYLYIKRRKIN